MLLLVAFPDRALAVSTPRSGTVAIAAPRLQTLWLAAVPHLVMDVGMVWMLVP